MRRKANGKNVLTAAQAHEEALEQAQALVERLCGLLTDRAAESSDAALDWGHVGRLTEVNRRLAAVAAFLAGEEV
jgi:hypothetical protein